MTEDNLYQHCLRPIFAENVIKDLKAHLSLNIYGAVGQGRGRLLEDIQKFQWDDSTKVLLVDMKNYRDSYASFLQELWRQFGGVGEIPRDFSALLDEFKKVDQHLIILLHHFESLLDNPTVHRQFNVKFFDNLNSIRNHSNMSLICITEKKHSSSVIYIGDKTHRGSWLNLQSKRLLKLTFDEIRYEIKRRIEHLSGEELRIFANAVYVHQAPYLFLGDCCDNYLNHANEEMTLSQRLQLWKTQYSQDHPFLSPSNLNRFSNKIVCTCRALRIPELFNYLLTAIKAFLGDIFTAVFEWWTGQKSDKKPSKRVKRK